MKKITWKDINWAEKLSSRKFWGFVAVLATSVCIILRAGDDVQQLIIGLISAIADLAVYCFANVQQKKILTVPTVDKDAVCEESEQK